MSDEIGGLDVYMPGEEDTTEAMIEHLGGWAPVGCSEGVPSFDRMRWVPMPCGCCMALELHDECNDVTYTHGPVRRRDVRTADDEKFHFNTAAHTAAAPFN